MSRWLEDFIVKKSDSVYYAHWKLYRSKAILAVLDDDGRFAGVVTIGDMAKSYWNEKLRTVGDVCNTHCKYVTDEGDVIEKARSIFADFRNVNHIPVTDGEGRLTDIISREQAFWKQYYDMEKLPRMHYAYCMYMAALEASTLGYKSISVIEFGVAGGNGLLNCEFHARALSRLFGIDIEIYGFDLGSGLPMENEGYKDMVHVFHGGDYTMNEELLRQRLDKSVLVMGNICDTTESFIAKYRPAPIGAVLVDVDYYSSAKPVLEFLKEEDEAFLPRIYTYWDDISPEYEFSGENLAIHEFNCANETVKISPEREYYQNYRRKIKICHKFSHPRYNDHSDVYIGPGSLRQDKPFFFHELPMQGKQL